VKHLTGSAGTVLAGPSTWRHNLPGSEHIQWKPGQLLANIIRGKLWVNGAGGRSNL
jgi:hypothetical protein